MTPQDVLSKLDETDALAEVSPFWDESMGAMPPGGQPM